MNPNLTRIRSEHSNHRANPYPSRVRGEFSSRASNRDGGNMPLNRRHVVTRTHATLRQSRDDDSFCQNLHPQTPDCLASPIAPFLSKRRSRNPNLLLRFLFELFWAAFAQSLAANFLNENGLHRERATLRVTHIGNFSRSPSHAPSEPLNTSTPRIENRNQNQKRLKKTRLMCTQHAMNDA